MQKLFYLSIIQLIISLQLCFSQGFVKSFGISPNISWSNRITKNYNQSHQRPFPGLGISFGIDKEFIPNLSFGCSTNLNFLAGSVVTRFVTDGTRMVNRYNNIRFELEAISKLKQPVSETKKLVYSFGFTNSFGAQIRLITQSQLQNSDAHTFRNWVPYAVCGFGFESQDKWYFGLKGNFGLREIRTLVLSNNDYTVVYANSSSHVAFEIKKFF